MNLHPMTLSAFAAALALAAGTFFSHPAAADDVADFYKGKTVTLYAGFPAGGGYDLYARLIARHLSRHLPGNPNVIVQNMPGGASMTAANHVSNVAAQDGTAIAATSAVLPFQPLLEVQSVKFDAAKTHWLPVPTGETNLVSVWHTVPLNSFLETRNRETLMGTTGPNSQPAFFGRIFNDVFKTKLKLIHGYAGAPEVFLAMERGEVEGHASATWGTYKTVYGNWIAEKKVKFLLQYGSKPNPELPEVPFARDLAQSDEDKLLLDISMAPTALGRPYMMGPGVPAERVAAMRKAFMEALKDPALLEDARKATLDIDPLTGEEVQALIEKGYGAPQRIIDRLRTLYKAQPN